MDAPQVAVIIPLYNASRWIAETLAGVFAQTHAPAEVVVVDDGSSDDGMEIVAREFPAVRLLRNTGKGTDTARRLGQAQTSAPLVAFLDQDDLWHPDHLRLLVALLDRHPEAPAAVGRTLDHPDGEPPRFDAPRLDPYVKDPWDHFPGTFTPTPSGVLIRREALDAAAGWPTNYVGVGDFHAWLVLSVHQPFVVNRCTTALKRIHQTSHSKRLVAGDASLYVRNKRHAALDALDVYEAAHPEQKVAVNAQRTLTYALDDAVNALLAEDRERFADAAHDFEDALAGASDHQMMHALGMIAWYLRPRFETLGESKWRWLFRYWPHTAPRTYAFLEARGSLRSQIRHALHRSLSLRRWRKALRTVKRRSTRWPASAQ